MTYTKIQNGKKILDVANIDDFDIDDSMPNILREFNFKYERSEESFNNVNGDQQKITTSIWSIANDIKIYLSYVNGIIEAITLQIKAYGNFHRYNRYKRIWFLNGSKEIGVDSDMVNDMMDKIRSEWR
jgi:hypothetical protein